MKCGLLGKKLGHSYSPKIHGYLADYSYDLFEKQPDELGDFLKHGDFSGINVTMPYKKDVLPYLDEISPVAQKLGAVNTIVRRDGCLLGHNSDYRGFQSMVSRSNLIVKDKKILVLGSGGASATAVAVLKELGANVIVISRAGENNYQNLFKHSDASVIVNATPVGMFPNVGISPVDLSLFPKLEGVLDIVYNPSRTQLLLDAQSRGLVTENGLWMLVAQAKESAEWFLNTEIDDKVIGTIYDKLRFQMENLVLIGMPGSGKTTVGQLLAKKTGKKFIDADAEVVLKAGMSIPEIFDRFGEDAFRQFETQVLAEHGMQSGLVIATGGGCVTRRENYRHLHQNGQIIWLKRSLGSLPTDGRPLSMKYKLDEMYRIREPLYADFSDKIIINENTPEDAVSAILRQEEI